jgi:hypothetical protein
MKPPKHGVNTFEVTPKVNIIKGRALNIFSSYLDYQVLRQSTRALERSEDNRDIRKRYLKVCHPFLLW